MAEPDLDGFREAQATLREKFGRDVVFLRYEAATYPPGTQVDPESGEPYDPTIQPTTSALTSAAVRASVFNRPAGNAYDEEASPLAWMETGQAILSVDKTVFDGLSLDSFDEVEMMDERWQIQRTNSDGIGPDPDHRVLVGVQRK